MDEVVDLEHALLACNTCNHEAPFTDFALERGVMEHIHAAPPGSFHRILLCCPNCEAPGAIEGYFRGGGDPIGPIGPGWRDGEPPPSQGG